MKGLNITGLKLTRKIKKRINQSKKYKFKAIKRAIDEAKKSFCYKSSYGASILNKRTGEIFGGHNYVNSFGILSNGRKCGIHAEQNCISSCRNKSKLRNNCILYLVRYCSNKNCVKFGLPCSMCEKILLKYGLKKIVICYEKKSEQYYKLTKTIIY